MNVLYSIVGRDYHEMLIKKMMRHLEVKNQVAISELWKVDPSIYSAIYEFSDVYWGRYHKYKEDVMIPPVDEKMIEELMPKALEIIKMMDRPYTWETGFEERLQLYLKHLRFWNGVIDLFHIDCAIFFNVPHEVFDYVIYSICRTRNIKTVVLCGIPNDLFKGRSFWSTDFTNEWIELKKMIDEKKFDSEIEEAVKQYNKYYSACTDIKANLSEAKGNWVHQSSMSDNIKAMAVYEIRAMLERQYSGKIDVSGVRDGISRIFNDKLYFNYRNTLIQELVSKNEKRIDYYESLATVPNWNEKYVYFALHYQPEATSSPWGGGLFVNQLIPIRMICSLLPPGYVLYIKEHPSQTHIGRSTLLYDEIAQIKNAKLISLDTDNIDLIRSAVATATLTGTTAMESVLNGIPCITFGKYIYNAMEGVFPVRTNDDCRNAINTIVGGKFKINQDRVKDFFCAVYQFTIPVNVGYGSYNMVKNAENAVEGLISILEKEDCYNG